MRDPSIHIKKSDLQNILNKLGVDIDSKTLNQLMVLANKVSIINRSVSISNEKNKKEVTKKLESNKSDADLISNIIYSTRVKLKHRGVRQIKQSDKDWLQIKALAKNCNQFCDEFNLDKREGYIKYVEIGFSKISSFHSHISKLINMYEAICTDFQSIQDLYSDTNPKGTKEIHDVFIGKVAQRTGLYNSYDNNPKKMYCFLKARELSDELGVDYEDFIDAQFEALDFCDGLPLPEQLYNDKARERLTKYLYQNKIKVKTKTSENIWDKFKK